MTVRNQLLALTRLALPIWIAQMLVMSWGVADTAMLSGLPHEQLAALAVGGSFYMAFAVAGKGVLQALSPHAAIHYGAGQLATVGLYTRQALWLALVLAFIGLGVMHSSAWLDLAALAPAVRSSARQYLFVISFGLFGSFGFRVITAFFQATGQPAVITLFLIAGTVVKLALNQILVFGIGPIPALGVVGCAAATACCNLMMCAAGLAYLAASSALRASTPFASWRLDWGCLRVLIRGGVPFGLSYWLEAGVFAALTLAISPLGTDALAASQIVWNFANLLYLTPLALSLAAATLAGQALGRGEQAQACRIGLGAAVLAGGLALICGGTAWLFPEIVIRLYRVPAPLHALIIPLLGWLVLYHLGDALQSIAAFMNRSWLRFWWPVAVYGACMWALALSLGRTLAAGRLTAADGLAAYLQAMSAGLWLAALLMGGYWSFKLRKAAFPQERSSTCSQIARPIGSASPES